MRPVLVLASRVALAVGAVARVAGADPGVERALTAPTAWLPVAGGGVVTAGLDHHGNGSFSIDYGLGGLAAVELDGDTDVRACDGCTTPVPVWLGRAGFRLGARQDAWFGGQPALAFGVRATFAGDALGGPARVADLYAVASRVVGPLRLHAGVEALDASAGGRRMGAAVRPSGAIELVPPQYPKTTMLVDLAYVPRLERSGPVLESLAGFGVRYQAFSWAAVELAVRHRGGESFADSTVLVRAIIEWGR